MPIVRPLKPVEALRCLRQWLEQFDAVSERVRYVNTVKAGKRLVGRNEEAGRHAASRKFVKASDEQSRVCFARRLKSVLDTQMKFGSAGAEPCPTTGSEMRGLRTLSKAQNIGIKRARLVFASAGHCQLHVVQSKDGHRRYFTGSIIDPLTP